VLYLARHRPADPAELDRQARALSWHALPYGGGLAFPGEQLMRLSMDLATGTAGVLLALAAAAASRRRGCAAGRHPRDSRAGRCG